MPGSDSPQIHGTVRRTPGGRGRCFTSRVVDRAVLDAPTIDKMFALFEDYFDHPSRQQFDNDLAEKDWVCLGVDEMTGEIGGFSTLVRRDAVVDGRRVIACYSGDTIVGRAFRSQLGFLPGTVGRRIYEEGCRSPGTPVYWLLLSSGYKTYRVLPLFVREFYPRFNQPTPPETRRLMGTLAALHYGGQFDPDRGIVRFAQPTPLKASVADVDERRLRDPHVRFFTEINPGHAQGDELVCIAEICGENLTPAGRRYGLGQR